VAAQESRRDDRDGHDRQWPAGAGPEYELVLTGRVVATLVTLRFQVPQAALVLFYGVDRSVITRAVHEVRRPRAAHGFAVPHRHGQRVEVARAGGGEERVHDPALQREVGVGLGRGSHSLAGPAGQLARGVRGPPHHLRNLRERHREDVVQHERESLRRSSLIAVPLTAI
jgi:hypothetical protein